MGLSQSKKKPDPAVALAVVASPYHGGSTRAQTPTTPSHMAVDLNTSLNDTAILLSQDSEWLDEGEMHAMEDEDAIMIRELSATNTGEMSLEDWMQTREADVKMAVRVVSTSTINKFMGRKTVEYTIETDTGQVKRRYKDFLALRYGLEVRFPGAFVPPLPGSKRLGKTDAVFLLKRKRLLQMFLQTIARHPFLSADDLFVEFIASTTRFDRKSAWKPRSQLVRSQKWSVSARRWAQALLQVDTPANPQATMEAASSELSQAMKSLQGMKTSLKRNAIATAAMAESLHDVAAMFSKSSVQESQLVLFTGAANNVTEPLARVFAQGDTLCTQSADVIRRYPDALDEAILSPIRFEMQCIESFQEALRRTKFSIARHRQAVNAYRQAREQTDVNSFKAGLQVAVQAEVANDGSSPPQTAQLLQSPGSSNDLDKIRKRLQRTRLTAVQAQMHARRDINGILALELQRFRSERQARMNRSFADYMTVHRSQNDGVAQIWSTALANFGMQTTEDASSSRSARTSALPRAPIEQEIPSRIEEVSPGDEPRPTGLEAMDSASFMSQSQIDEMIDNKSRRSSQLRAKYPFQGIHEDELDVDEGEVLEGTVDDENPEWVRAKSLQTGKIGLVPKTYVEEINEGAGGGDDDDDDDDEEDESKRASTNYGSEINGEPTNYIKQTQDMFKGTKRTNTEREAL